MPPEVRLYGIPPQIRVLGNVEWAESAEYRRKAESPMGLIAERDAVKTIWVHNSRNRPGAITSRYQISVEEF
jgi:hypothetical protein